MIATTGEIHVVLFSNNAPPRSIELTWPFENLPGWKLGFYDVSVRMHAHIIKSTPLHRRSLENQ